eukprot:3592347-Rhodomonas_salina.1
MSGKELGAGGRTLPLLSEPRSTRCSNACQLSGTEQMIGRHRVFTTSVIAPLGPDGRESFAVVGAGGGMLACVLHRCASLRSLNVSSNALEAGAGGVLCASLSSLTRSTICPWCAMRLEDGVRT